MSTTTAPTPPAAASRGVPFAASTTTRVVTFLLLAYTVYAVAQLDFSWNRFVEGLGHGARLIGKMFPPDLGKWDILVKGMVESMQIAVLATVLGISISLPLGFLGARNLMPGWVTWIARAIVAICRSLHPVIVAILFVMHRARQIGA